MATIIYSNGTAEVTVPANEKIAVFSNSPVSISQLVGYPNFPDSWSLLETTDAGEEYVSSAFSSGATLRVEASAAQAFYETGSNPSVAEPQADISGADATFTVSGLAAAQGGYVEVKGGTSSTSGNAGGAAKLTGGQPGATGVGGAATVAAGAGGATSGAGGVASVTGGAGTAGNSAGGVASVTGGAGQGSAAGGIGKTVGGQGGATGAGGKAQLTGGAGGATSGAGGASEVTGGAGTAGNGNGGSVVLTGGAKHGTGADGCVIARSTLLVKQGAPTAKTTDATLTAAEVLAGIITVNQGAAGTSSQTLPLAADMDTALPDAAAGDAFDFSVINISTNAAEDATIITNTGWTLVGEMTVESNDADRAASSGRFRARKTGAGAWTLYRLS